MPNSEKEHGGLKRRKSWDEANKWWQRMGRWYFRTTWRCNLVVREAEGDVNVPGGPNTRNACNPPLIDALKTISQHVDQGNIYLESQEYQRCLVRGKDGDGRYQNLCRLGHPQTERIKVLKSGKVWCTSVSLRRDFHELVNVKDIGSAREAREADEDVPARSALIAESSRVLAESTNIPVEQEQTGGTSSSLLGPMMQFIDITDGTPHVMLPVATSQRRLLVKVALELNFTVHGK
ncbi:hypothetical protein JB92DRAFT_3094449 [Gautieria morchelliformis]|nr:hypothetical protein JB92DRAFT_3094449 [Gautieria morchelliformis]